MNTLIVEGGRGSNRIIDTTVHANLSVGQIEILEDTEFESVFKQTSTDQGNTWSVGVEIVASGDDPGVGPGHKAGEYISLITLGGTIERISQIKLASGSIRYYNT